MCTVTFIPREENKFILTSNRDEASLQNTQVPKKHLINGVQVVFPKDEKQDGIWIGVSEYKRLVCLLNGIFSFDKNKSELRRGHVVEQLLIVEEMMNAICNMNLIGVEPFKLVLIDWEDDLKLIELVWDGKNKEVKWLPIKPYIWSSALLYDKETQEKRRIWFNKFSKEEELDQEAILHFHHTAGEGNSFNNMIIDRAFVKTKSITSFATFTYKNVMQYEDFKSNTISRVFF